MQPVLNTWQAPKTHVHVMYASIKALYKWKCAEGNCYDYLYVLLPMYILLCGYSRLHHHVTDGPTTGQSNPQVRNSISNGPLLHCATPNTGHHQNGTAAYCLSSRASLALRIWQAPNCWVTWHQCTAFYCRVCHCACSPLSPSRDRPVVPPPATGRDTVPC